MIKILTAVTLILLLIGCTSIVPMIPVHRDNDITSQLTVTTYMGGDVRIKYVDRYNEKEFSLGLGGKEDYTIFVERSPKNIEWPRNTMIKVSATFLDGYKCQNNNYVRAPEQK